MRASAIRSESPGAPNGQEDEDRITAKVELPAKTKDANTGENGGTRSGGRTGRAPKERVFPKTSQSA
jgi:hypothetical protein